MSNKGILFQQQGWKLVIKSEIKQIIVLSVMSLQGQIKIPRISCLKQNHYGQSLQLICMNRECMRQNSNLLCFYCLQQSHNHHVSETLSLGEFIGECLEMVRRKQKKKQGKESKKIMLLTGIAHCKDKQQLTGLLQQLYRTVYAIDTQDDNKGGMIQSLVNEQVRRLKQTNNMICSKMTINPQGSNQTPNHQTHLQSLYGNNKNNKLTTPSTFHQPILSFSNQQPAFTLLSPFEIKHNNSHSISTIFAYPSLNTYSQSLQIVIKIVKSTPNWIALGLAVGECKYEQKSKNHISLLSNGWLNNKGQLTQSKEMIFESGQQVKIKWDKEKKMVIFRNLTTKNESIIRFQPQWHEDVFLFATMFYKHDTISIMQSSAA